MRTYNMNAYLEKCSYNRWLEKEVTKSLVIFDGKNFDISSISKKDYDGFDFKIVKEDECIKILYNSNISHMSKRPSVSVKFGFNRGDYSEYNRVHLKMYVKANGIRNIFMIMSLSSAGNIYSHAPSIPVNQWFDCIFEVNGENMLDISYFTIVPFIGGCPPESNGDIEILISSISLEKVEAEYEKGYEIGNRIAYSHLGYYPFSRKEFIVEGINEYKILKGDDVVKIDYTKKCETELGTFGIGDFSEITGSGKYRIEYNGKETDEFSISDDPYCEAIEKSLEFLKQLRCGVDVLGVHSACHLHSVTKDENGSQVPNFGGWHDAGDLSQFEIPTAIMTSYLLELFNSRKNERILEEAKVGLQWLLQTTFHNGNRALSVSYDKWYDNIKEVETRFPNNVSENGPFENFIASQALALGAIAFKDVDKIYSDYCLKVAKEDFEFAKNGYEQGLYTKRWGPSIPAQALGSALSAASALYQITKDEKYLEVADNYATIVMSCQEREYVGVSKKIRGFFYEDPEHNFILTYEHRGHESSPICGLVDLCKVAKNHKDYDRWIESIKLYKEYIESCIDYTRPYNFLIGHIYHIEKLNFTRFTIPGYYCSKENGIEQLRQQVQAGVDIGNGWYIRKMPIAVQRRGFHATLLSKTKAVSSIANLLKSDELKQICIDQIEWILGKNPFATSTMFGVGNNYHPLYVAYSLQLIGSLPVGFETLGNDDEPYWPTRCEAVYKEIWGHTTGFLLGIFADIEW